eukprot:TRINITY_DN7198_c0_g3_i1.p1 TRINITY_DN7198_c0_g3~~TRINITY_DN7198_c0_g3_i1.p1  ORF type:complete len:1126 (+),score=262.24 TRINITY_DN7198_c0_g3_i1:316-3378(+)
MAAIQQDVAVQTKKAQEKIRSYEMQYRYLSEELVDKKNEEKEIRREVSYMKRKVEETRENAAWERDTAVQALQVAIKKEGNINRELEGLPEKIESEMKKKLEKEIGKGDLKKFDQEEMIKAIVARVTDGYNLQHALTDLVESLKAQLEVEIPSVSTVSSHESDVSPVFPFMPDPEPEAPPTPSSSFLDGNDADYLLMQVEHPNCRMLRSMSPCFMRLQQSLQASASAALCVLVAAALPDLTDYFKNWVPETLCLNLRLGDSGEMTTTCVRLITAEDGTATYEADLEISRDAMASLSPRSPAARSRSRSRSRPSSSVQRTPNRQLSQTRLSATPNRRPTQEERMTKHLQRKLEYEVEAKKRAVMKAEQLEKDREHAEKERRRKEAQTIIRNKLTPKKVAPKREPPNAPTSPVQELLTSAMVHTSVEELVPHMLLREKIDQVVSDLKKEDSVQGSENGTSVTGPMYPVPHLHFHQEQRSPRTTLQTHSASLQTDRAPDTGDVADRLRRYSLAVAKGTGINIVDETMTKRPSKPQVLTPKGKRSSATVIQLHSETPDLGSTQQRLANYSFPLHEATRHSPPGNAHMYPTSPSSMRTAKSSPNSKSVRVDASARAPSVPESVVSPNVRLHAAEQPEHSTSPAGSPRSGAGSMRSLPSAASFDVQEQMRQQQKREMELERILQEQDLNSSNNSTMKKEYTPQHMPIQQQQRPDLSVQTRPDDATVLSQASPIYSQGRSVVALDGLLPPMAMDKVSFIDDAIQLPHGSPYEGWVSPFDQIPTPPSSTHASKTSLMRYSPSSNSPRGLATTLPQDMLPSSASDDNERHMRAQQLLRQQQQLLHHEHNSQVPTVQQVHQHSPQQQQHHHQQARYLQHQLQQPQQQFQHSQQPQHTQQQRQPQHPQPQQHQPHPQPQQHQPQQPQPQHLQPQQHQPQQQHPQPLQHQLQQPQPQQPQPQPQQQQQQRQRQRKTDVSACRSSNSHRAAFPNGTSGHSGGRSVPAGRGGLRPDRSSETIWRRRPAGGSRYT